MFVDALGYYKVLDVDYDADDKAIKLSYHNKAKFWHPDHNESENALEVFQKISVAYDILKDTKTRIMYDMLSMVYSSKDFPDFNTLKAYKDNNGNETPFLRVLRLLKYTKKGFKIEKPVVSFDDAIMVINKITKENWIKGWIKPKENINALKLNFKNINRNTDDNFKMLIHNAVSYFKEDKKDKAYISAKESLNYASENQKNMVYSFLNSLPEIHYNNRSWNYEYLKNIQLKFPKIFISCIISFCIICGVGVLNKANFYLPQKHDNINYYQKVRFNNGNQTVDDMVLSKIFNIPVDLYDDKMIFHINQEVDIMYGPSSDFDILQKSQKNQTVRVTGYTPDKQWYRVMVDDGNMGFVNKKYLKKGLGNPIPDKSKIIKNNER